MRINFLLPPVGMSGGIRVVAIYAKWLSEQGHDVTLISVPKRPLSLREKIRSLKKGNGWPITGSINRSHLDGLGLDHRVLDKWRPPTNDDVPPADVLIATWWETAEWACKLHETKGAKVYFIQGYEVFPYLPVERVHATYRLPMQKITVARWIADVMREKYGDANCDVVPNSVDKNQFFAPIRVRQARPTVGFLFSEMPLKGLDVSLEVVCRLRKAWPNIRAICFGSHVPSTDALTRAGAEFYLSPRQASIKDLYAQCDVWLSTSRSEGFNLMAMEAMACRTPVVSTRTGWPDEAIKDGWNGFLVDINDADAAVACVDKIFRLSEDEWSVYSENAFRTVDACSWDSSAEMFEVALIKAFQQANIGKYLALGEQGRLSSMTEAT